MKPNLPRRQSNLNFSTMGNRESMDYSTESPGPGKYSADDLPKPKKGISFGQAERASPVLGESPGPGSYNLGGADDVPSWSPLKHSFAKAKRSENTLNDQHDNGPGQYEISDSIFQKGFIPTRINRSFSPQKTVSKKVKQVGPGPGSYYLPRDLSHKGIIMATAKRTATFSDTEGLIGDSYYRYNSHKDLLNMSRAVTIGNSKRTSLPKLDPIPGPSQYSPNIDTVKAKKFQGSFEKQEKANYKFFRNKSLEPGPGDYNSFEVSTKYPVSFKGKHASLLSNVPLGPGPGSYSLKDPFQMSENEKLLQEEKARRALLKRIAHNSSIMSSVHGNERDSADASTITGGMSVNKSQKSLIKNSSRSTFMDQILIPKSPGPIYYLNQSDIATHVGKTGHRFEISKRSPTDPKIVPGPGVYNTDFHKREIAEVKFATSKRTDLIKPPQADWVPGVGNYTLKSDFEQIKPGGFMAKAARENEIKKRPKRLKQRSYIFEDMIQDKQETAE